MLIDEEVDTTAEEVSVKMSETIEFYVDMEVSGVEMTHVVVDTLADLMDAEGAHVAVFAVGDAGTRVSISLVTPARNVAEATAGALALVNIFDTPVTDLVVSLKVRTGEELDADLEAELSALA